MKYILLFILQIATPQSNRVGCHAEKYQHAKQYAECEYIGKKSVKKWVKNFFFDAGFCLITEDDLYLVEIWPGQRFSISEVADDSLTLTKYYLQPNTNAGYRFQIARSDKNWTCN